MYLMGKIGEINVLVGDEVAGAISAELVDVPWDKAFQALLDMKNYASDIDVNSNLIEFIHLMCWLHKKIINLTEHPQ